MKDIIYCNMTSPTKLTINQYAKILLVGIVLHIDALSSHECNVIVYLTAFMFICYSPEHNRHRLSLNYTTG